MDEIVLAVPLTGAGSTIAGNCCCCAGRLVGCNASCVTVRVARIWTVASGPALRVVAELFRNDERALRRGREPLLGPLAGGLLVCLFVRVIPYNGKTYRTVCNRSNKGLYIREDVINSGTVGQQEKRC